MQPSSSLCAADVDVPSEAGRQHVRLFCNQQLLSRDGDAGGLDALRIPALTIGLADRMLQAEQHKKMLRMRSLFRNLRDGIADASTAHKVTFSLHAHPAKDTFDFGHCLEACTACEAREARELVASFLRSHVFDAWRGLEPALAVVHGRFYIFDPFVKDLKGATVNTEWHQDGASLVRGDDFFAHYYFDDDDADGAKAGLGATDWAELALPAPARAYDATALSASAADDASDDDEEEALVFDWSGLSDDTRKEQIGADTFLALPTRARLLVLHDAECFHRVPLAALLRHPRRTIARVEFHGRSAAGEPLYVGAGRVGPTGAPAAREWRPLPPPHERLPARLQALCRAFACELAVAPEPIVDGHDGGARRLEAGADEGAEDGEAARVEALDAYVAARPLMTAWLERQLARHFELKARSTDLSSYG